MTELRISEAQADMRSGYLCGAPGIAASATAWLAASAAAFAVSSSAAVWTLLIAGAFIHPAGVLIAKGLGVAGAHRPGNPLARLAMEGTVWMLAGIAVAFGLSVLRIEWFFPAMLLVIGGRYLTFQSLYGLRLYWALGATLCAAGVALALGRAPTAVSALAGGLIEVVFAGLVFARARRDAA
jgi:hypothetical protein